MTLQDIIDAVGPIRVQNVDAARPVLRVVEFGFGLDTPGAVTWCKADRTDLLPKLRNCIVIAPPPEMPEADWSVAPDVTVLQHDQPRLAFLRAARLFDWPVFWTNRANGTVVARDRVQIDPSAIIGANCTIGGVGFGYEKDEHGKYQNIPHLGGVVIGENVEIGNNVCIDRGTIGDTVIGDGVKIDNLVHVAHNVKVGANSIIIAHAMIGGSAVIGENCWIAPCACIRNGITIGDGVTVGLAANVLKDVPAGATVVGNPAREI